MIQVTVQVKGLDQTLKRWGKLPVEAQNASRELLNSWGSEITRLAKYKSPVDTGRLRSSIGYEVSISATSAYATAGPTVKYAPPVEYGSRPHWPPSGALQPWARRHGFPMGARGDWLLRSIIAKRGTKPHPFLAPASEEVERTILPRLVDSFNNQIQELL